MEPERRRIRLGSLDPTLWGEPSDRLLVTVHGKHSHQSDADIMAATQQALGVGEQVLTWDLPGHGARPGNPTDCRITDSAAELDQIWDWAAQQYARQRVFATSIGVYLTLLTAPQPLLDQAMFLSPVVDMTGLVDGLMTAFSITVDALRERGRIDAPVEPLEWSQYEFISSHPVTEWSVPTRVLRGGRDELVPIESIRNFCALTGADLTIAQDAEHYFHTPADMEALSVWLDR